jgi:hypothetical protein
MLAFESAWRIPISEHARVRAMARELLRFSDADGGLIGESPDVSTLLKQLKELQSFDVQLHRPKGSALVAALRGQSAECDALLDKLETEQEQCNELLARAISLAAEAERGRERSDELREILKTHVGLLLTHLDEEDTTLRRISKKWLTPEDWSAIVSSISTVLHANERPRGGD